MPRLLNRSRGTWSCWASESAARCWRRSSARQAVPHAVVDINGERVRDARASAASPSTTVTSRAPRSSSASGLADASPGGRDAQRPRRHDACGASRPASGAAGPDHRAGPLRGRRASICSRQGPARPSPRSSRRRSRSSGEWPRPPRSTRPGRDRPLPRFAGSRARPVGCPPASQSRACRSERMAWIVGRSLSEAQLRPANGRDAGRRESRRRHGRPPLTRGRSGRRCPVPRGRCRRLRPLGRSWRRVRRPEPGGDPRPISLGCGHHDRQNRQRLRLCSPPSPPPARPSRRSPRASASFSSRRPPRNRSRRSSTPTPTTRSTTSSPSSTP